MHSRTVPIYFNNALKRKRERCEGRERKEGRKGGREEGRKKGRKEGREGKKKAKHPNKLLGKYLTDGCFPAALSIT